MPSQKGWAGQMLLLCWGRGRRNSAAWGLWPGSAQPGGAARTHERAVGPVGLVLAVFVFGHVGLSLVGAPAAAARAAAGLLDNARAV